MMARSFHKFHDVLDERIRDIHVVNRLHRFHEFFRRADRALVQQIELSLHDCALFRSLNPQREVAIEDFAFFIDVRIIESMEEHEPVQLRFRQLERPALFDGVLRRNHEKRSRQWKRFLANGDLALLHRLQQSTLDLGSRSVDFVRQEQVREDRPLHDSKFVVPLIEHLASQNVRREEVDRELYPGKAQIDRPRKCGDKQGLRQTGHALEQQVSAGEQGHEQSFDNGVLPDDGFSNLHPDSRDKPDRASRGFARNVIETLSLVSATPLIAIATVRSFKPNGRKRSPASRQSRFSRPLADDSMSAHAGPFPRGARRVTQRFELHQQDHCRVSRPGNGLSATFAGQDPAGDRAGAAKPNTSPTRKRALDSSNSLAYASRRGRGALRSGSPGGP